MRNIVSGADPGEVTDFATIGLGIISLVIPLTTDVDRGIQVDDQETLLSYHLAGPLTDFFAGSDKGGDADQSCIVE